MEANQQWTTIITLPSRPWILVGSLLVGRNTEEAMILLVGDQLLGPKGALLASSMCRFATHMVETRRLLVA
jgi:hypothetical protein